MPRSRRTGIRTAVLLAGFLFDPATAASQSVEPGISEVGTGDAAAALVPGVWMRSNPARIAGLAGWRTEAFASDAFGLPELRLLALSGAVPLGRSALGAEVRTFGFAPYRELDVGIGYARIRSPDRSVPGGIGIATIVRHTRIAGYGVGRDWGLLAGSWIRWRDGLTLAARIGRTPDPRGWSRSSLAWTIGVGYGSSDRSRLFLDVAGSGESPPSLRTGLIWRAVGPVRIHAGWRQRPSTISTGVTVALGDVRAGLGGRSHPVLGWTPAVSLGAEHRP